MLLCAHFQFTLQRNHFQVFLSLFLTLSFTFSIFLTLSYFLSSPLLFFSCSCVILLSLFLSPLSHLFLLIFHYFFFLHPFQVNRFVDVDFNALDTTINQQTWVALLDFFGIGEQKPAAGSAQQFPAAQTPTENSHNPHPEKGWWNARAFCVVRLLPAYLAVRQGARVCVREKA